MYKDTQDYNVICSVDLGFCQKTNNNTRNLLIQYINSRKSISLTEQKIPLIYIERQFVKNTFCDATILIRQ